MAPGLQGFLPVAWTNASSAFAPDSPNLISLDMRCDTITHTHGLALLVHVSRTPRLVITLAHSAQVLHARTDIMP